MENIEEGTSIREWLEKNRALGFIRRYDKVGETETEGVIYQIEFNTDL